MALLEDEELVEVMFDRPDQDRMVGDIFLGRVDAVLPGIQAAFVDIGTGKAGFLHVGDLNSATRTTTTTETGTVGAVGAAASASFRPSRSSCRRGSRSSSR